MLRSLTSSVKFVRHSHNIVTPLFVRKAKMLNYWSQSDDALEAEFGDSEAYVMVDKEPLVEMDRNLKSVKLVKHNTSDLRNRLNQYGLEIGLLNSALLDCSCPNEHQRDFRAIFGCAVRTLKPPPESGIPENSLRRELAQSLGGEFISLRLAMLTLDTEHDRRTLAKFQAVTRWYHTYRRCPTCSTPLRVRPSKSAARCIRCDRFYYPTMSPVAISLVRDPSNSKVLLVKHRGSVPTVFTMIAGFASTGESLHDTARREIAEEVGIEVDQVEMLNSTQPWPMPFNSLMCGFTAVADPSHSLDICPDELEAAHWFSREQVQQAIRRVEEDPFLKGAMKHQHGDCSSHRFLYIPPHGAIAHEIIKKWAFS